MVLLESNASSLGTSCPSFRLPGVDGRSYGLEDFAAAPALLVAFLCNHCPYVQAVEDRVIALHREFGERGLALVGICANDPAAYPDDAPAELARRWREKAYGFPYLVDASQDVARAFGAVCTPEFHLFDRERRLAYQGRLDDSWKEPARVTRRELAAAIEALLRGERPSREQHPSMGCSIKWRKESPG